VETNIQNGAIQLHQTGAGWLKYAPPLKIYRGIYCERAYVGGNWNNDLNCGPFYANLYNEPSNTNTNIGAALSYSLRNNPL
jgi:hypothetical protein